MPASEIQLFARAFVTAYGICAEAKAREFADNIRKVDTREGVVWWERVIVAIQAIKAEDP